MDDGGAGVLAERKHTFDGRFRIAQELQGHIFVVVRGLGVAEDRRHLLVVGAPQHELAVMEGLPGDQREGFRGYFQQGLVPGLDGLDQFLRSRNLVILSRVGPQLEHRGVLKFYSHYVFVLILQI